MCSDTISIDEHFEQMKIGEVGDLYISQNHTKDIQRILSLSDDIFKPIEETGLSFAPTNEVYWMRILLKNTSNVPQDIVVSMEYPLMNLLQFYTISNNRIDSTVLMGDNFPFHQRPVKHHYFLHQLTLGQNELVTLYIYFNKANENSQLFTTVWNEDIFSQVDKQNTIFWSIYTGLSLCLFLLILSAAIFSQQKLLYYFAIYSICTFMVIFTNIGWGFQYLWSTHPAFNQVANYTFVIIFLVAFLELTRQFLKMPTTLPRLNRLFRFLQITISLFIGVLFTFKSYPPLILITTVYIGHILLIVIAICLFLAPILMYLKTKDFSYLLYILGFIFFLLSFIIHLLITLNVMEDTDLTRFSVPIGLTLDTFILIVLFGHQIKQTYIKNALLQKDLTQSQLSAANALLEGQLKERSRLSRELHDGISIKMALLKIQLKRFFRENKLERTSIITEISEISEEIRAFTHNISPLNLKEENLTDAIEDLIYTVENKTKIEVKLSIESFQEKELEDNQKHTLYQTLKELLNNTIKYAEATTVKILLSTNNHQAMLSYHDNGKGFNANKAKSTGIGLKNIQARADLLNGNFDIKSNNQGSQFEFFFNF
jgi:signal transduction histidine kinase